MITNSYFAKDMEVLHLAVRELGKRGVNDIMLSVDAENSYNDKTRKIALSSKR
ncbi:MAG: hypothetical protein K2L07_09605 [Lachnospiraceae bacterium]|nr:hypothetical protein [Lachnospiraceae bacterium]